MDEELKAMEEHMEDEMKEDGKQNRFRSWAVWVSVAGAVWIILQAFGLTDKWNLDHELAVTVFNALGSILVSLGILNNPTDKYNF